LEERSGLLAPSSLPQAQAQAQLERAAALAEQDAVLDSLSTAVGTLKELSGAISGELEEQAVMMDEASLSLELAKGDVDAVTKRITKFIETSGGVKWCSLLTGLTLLLIVLTYFALF